MLEGDLGDFTLPEILQLLAFTAKTGRLTLRGEGSVGHLDVRDGELVDGSSDVARLALARRALGAGLVDGETLTGVLAERAELPSCMELAAELVDAGALRPDQVAELVREQTVDALFDLMRWREGGFRFDPDRPVQPPAAIAAVARPVDDVLEEVTRRLDQWPSIEERTGAAEAVVTITRPGIDAAPEIPTEGWGLLALVDGRRTVSELAVLSGQGEFVTRRTLAELAESGVVAIGADAPGPVEALLEENRALEELELTLTGRPPHDAVSADDDGGSSSEDAQADESTDAPDADAEAGATGTPPTVPPPADPPVMAAVGEVTPLRVADEIPEPWTPDDALEVSEVGEVAEVPVPAERLRTDPAVDSDLIDRLIDGVERL